MKKERRAWEDITGRVFGRLTVERELGEEAICRCSCNGKLYVTNKRRLPTGNTTSCGCVRREQVAARAANPGPRKSKWIPHLKTVNDL